MTVQEKEYLLREGEGIFINAGLLHMARPAQGHKARYLCINIHKVMFSFFRGSLMEQKYFLPYIQSGSFFAVSLCPDVEWQCEILKCQHIISGLIEKKERGYELEVYIRLMLLWKELVLNTDLSGRMEFSVFRHEEIKKIMSYIQQHYAEHVSLQDIASSLHISKSGCCRLLTATQGPQRTGRSCQCAPLRAIQTMAPDIVRLSLGGRSGRFGFSGGTTFIFQTNFSTPPSTYIFCNPWNDPLPRPSVPHNTAPPGSSQPG